MSTLRMALHIAAVRDYNITQIDVSTAFLYGDIDVVAYMMMPEGLPRYDAEGYELVCKLLKSLYGLKQAPRIWYEHFLRSLLSFGFIRSEIDPCLFIYKKGGVTMYGLLWVDDLIILDDNTTRRDEFVTYLRIYPWLYHLRQRRGYMGAGHCHHARPGGENNCFVAAAVH